MSDESLLRYLEVDRNLDGCCATVRLSGEVDIASVDQVRDATREARDRDGAVHLIVDCHQLRFLDSSGVKALLEANTAFDGKVVLVQTRRVVTRVLEVTGLEHLFAFADSVAQAQEMVHTSKEAPPVRRPPVDDEIPGDTV